MSLAEGCAKGGKSPGWRCLGQYHRPKDYVWTFPIDIIHGVDPGDADAGCAIDLLASGFRRLHQVRRRGTQVAHYHADVAAYMRNFNGPLDRLFGQSNHAAAE